ncbi:MAG: xanthine dehydrogenase accessory protein XdhC [Pseudomonadota bacterium]
MKTETLKSVLNHPSILVRVAAARGSAPRDEDAFMVVNEKATAGTVGGGQLEYMAIDHARRMLSDDIKEDVIKFPLGPETGQCCGGNVTLRLEYVKNPAPLLEQASINRNAEPHVYVFGTGHVGKALCIALSALPVVTHAVDQREAELSLVTDEVEKHLSALPEAIIENAPPGSAFVAMTHDHALDFLIIASALKRRDTSYVGMIGSKTKRVQFERWHQREGGVQRDRDRLTSPIGGPSKDKRPAVIAAFAAAEILRALQADDTDMTAPVLDPAAEPSLS